METLIEGVLRDVKSLAENPAVSVATEMEVKKLAKAIEGAVSNNAGIAVRGCAKELYE